VYRVLSGVWRSYHVLLNVASGPPLTFPLTRDRSSPTRMCAASLPEAPSTTWRWPHRTMIALWAVRSPGVGLLKAGRYLDPFPRLL